MTARKGKSGAKSALWESKSSSSSGGKSGGGGGKGGHVERNAAMTVCFETEDSQLASELLRRVCAEHQLEHVDVVLHSDNGPAMKGSTMLATMRWLGIRPSFSRPGVSDDNAHVEALFRTLKYRPGYPARGFQSLEHARAWVDGFTRWYNHELLHSAIGFVTPDDRHSGRDIAILEHRKAVYEAAKRRTPRRWTGSTRSWHRPRVVLLNPERATRLRCKGQAMVA